MINCVSYVAVLGALWSLPAQPAAAKREEGESSMSAFVAGARHVWKNPWMAAAMGMALGISLFATPYLSLMPALARDVFHAGPILYGFAMGASGIGAAASGLAMAARPSVMAKSVMPWLGACGGLAMAAMASMPNAWWAMPFLTIVGFGLAGGASSANALVQSRVDPAMRGRVMGIFSMCLYGAAPLGIAAMGWVAELYGVRIAIEAGGLLSCASCTAIGVAGMQGAFRSVRNNDSMPNSRQEHEARALTTDSKESYKS
jgi:MFS family permease